MELLPCPFCGGNTNFEVDEQESCHPYRLTCYPCGIITTWQRDKECLYKSWNTRHSPWISVKDKLPENNSWILAYNGIDYCVCYIDIGNFDYLFMYGMGSQNQFKNVTHWMIPQPPKD